MLPRPNKNQPKGSIRPLAVLALLLWFGALGLVAVNRQNIIDWYKLRGYQAPAPVADLAAQDTMTAYGSKVFYVNHPVIDTKADFGSACPNNGGEQTIVLGCYHSAQSGIFLLAVTDPRLSGVEQVTAAHEMLHGAYERLNSSERQKVDAMLMDFYRHDLHDERLLKTMDAYKKSEPNDVVNEMHSVFGTEVAVLPAPLEQYYQRYFTDRSKVAGFAAQYQAEFTSRQTVVAQDDATLTQLKSQIDSTEADLKGKQVTISAQQTTLISLKASGNYTAYNAGVPVYNRQVNDYNGEVTHLQGLIGQYNQLVASRNAVALEENQLLKDLTTNVTQINN